MSRGTDGIWAVTVANLRASPAKSAILLVGALVLVFLVVRQLWGGAESAEAAGELAMAVTPENTEGTNAVEAVRAPPRARRRPLPRIRHTLTRNPFGLSWIGPLEQGAASETLEAGTEDEELTLQFTMKGAGADGSTLAVVSGVIVRPGSMVAGYQVVSIGVRHVVLRNAAREITLRMP